jgi:hypothetical protein
MTPDMPLREEGTVLILWPCRLLDHVAEVVSSGDFDSIRALYEGATDLRVPTSRSGR